MHFLPAGQHLDERNKSRKTWDKFFMLAGEILPRPFLNFITKKHSYKPRSPGLYSSAAAPGQQSPVTAKLGRTRRQRSSPAGSCPGSRGTRSSSWWTQPSGSARSYWEQARSDTGRLPQGWKGDSVMCRGGKRRGRSKWKNLQETMTLLRVSFSNLWCFCSFKVNFRLYLNMKEKTG